MSSNAGCYAINGESACVAAAASSLCSLLICSPRACACTLAGSYCGNPAALKLLILEEESAAAILNEVRLCLKLNHKNLVRLLDCAVVSTSSGQPAAPQVRALLPQLHKQQHI
jgi:hypothetical protein